MRLTIFEAGCLAIILAVLFSDVTAPSTKQKPSRTESTASSITKGGIDVALSRVTKKFGSSIRSSWTGWSPEGKGKHLVYPQQPPRGTLLNFIQTHPWTSINDIEMNGGDVIVCHLVDNRTHKGTHWFLAINRYEILHSTPWDNNHTAKIRADRKLEIADKYPKYINSMSCKNIGNGGYDIRTVIQRAMDWNVRIVFYDEDTCSSYHWVVYWVSGKVPRRFPGLQKRLHPMCRLRKIKEHPYPLDSDVLWEQPIEAFGVVEEFENAGPAEESEDGTEGESEDEEKEEDAEVVTDLGYKKLMEQAFAEGGSGADTVVRRNSVAKSGASKDRKRTSESLTETAAFGGEDYARPGKKHAKSTQRGEWVDEN